MGVAVQSHWFSVGSIVTWGEAGVGVVATQSIVDPGYGGKGLDLMRRGVSAPDALKQLLAADGEREVRQVAMLDAQGRVAAHTGHAVHRRGRPQGRRRLLGAGEHHGERPRLAGDGGGVRARHGRPGRPDARRARRGAGGRRRPARPAGGGDPDRGAEIHGPPVGGRRPALRPPRRGSSRSRSSNCGGWSGCSAPTPTPITATNWSARRRWTRR